MKVRFSRGLADLFRISRAKKGLSLSRTAPLIGTNVATIQRAEKGWVVGGVVKKKAAFARFCGVSSSEFQKLIDDAEFENASNFRNQDATPLIKLLATCGLDGVTPDEIYYLLRLFRRERWGLPKEPRVLADILLLHRESKKDS